MANLMTKPTLNKFKSQLLLSEQNQFTGRLDLKVTTGQKWSLYIKSGHLIWAKGNIHPYRRSHRLISHHCQMISWDKVHLRHSDRFECRDYHVLGILSQRDFLSEQKAFNVVKDTLIEIIFDIFHAIEQAVRRQSQPIPAAKSPNSSPSKSPDSVTELIEIHYHHNLQPSDDVTLAPSCFLKVEPVIQEVQRQWIHWLKAGLINCSPNLAPLIKDTKNLKQQTSSTTYKNLVTLINGKRTLRDLAWIAKQDLLNLTNSLIPFVRGKLISFVSIDDLKPVKKTTHLKASANGSLSNRPKLIACIEDNPQTCLIMQEILETAGYQFLGIQEAVQALPMLLQNKPDLIFLDLVMPHTNGYEICSQLRKINRFQKTPIVILTNNNGIGERLQAKKVGATDFISKPVDPYKVRSSLQKYLPKKRSE